jgi:hypothetical protein
MTRKRRRKKTTPFRGTAVAAPRLPGRCSRPGHGATAWLSAGPSSEGNVHDCCTL